MRFRSLYLNREINKFVCLFKPLLSLLLSYPLVCWILIFYFKTLIQISLLILTAKLMLIIPFYSWIIWTRFHNILLFVTLFPFYLLHIYPSVYFLSKYLTTCPEEIFFMDIGKSITFFMFKKGIKSNHNNLLSFFLFTSEFWVFGFRFTDFIY